MGIWNVCCTLLYVSSPDSSQTDTNRFPVTTIDHDACRHGPRTHCALLGGRESEESPYPVLQRVKLRCADRQT